MELNSLLKFFRQCFNQKAIKNEEDRLVDGGEGRGGSKSQFEMDQKGQTHLKQKREPKAWSRMGLFFHFIVSIARKRNIIF